MKITTYVFWLIIIVLVGGWFYSFSNRSFVSEKDTEILGGYSAENGDVKNSNEAELPAPISGWINYKNDDYGFSLQYPSDWEMQEALKPQNLKALHEIDFHAKEYELTRPYFTIQIFTNENKESVKTWWEKWLGEEDQKEAECKAEYKDEAPCLFLRGLIERETDNTLYGLPVKTVQLFQFDSSRECNYISYGDYVYGICYDAINPNDPNFENNKKVTGKMWSTFIFDDLIGTNTVSTEKGFEQYVPGNWQSKEDSKSLMVLKKGGDVENVYDGEKIDEGTWLIDGYKLKVTIGETEYVYTVVFAGSERLELTYLPRGNTLNFVRK